MHGQEASGEATHAGMDYSGCMDGQERIAKVEQARKETERILAEQQAEVERKKADMVSQPHDGCLLFTKMHSANDSHCLASAWDPLQQWALQSAAAAMPWRVAVWPLT